MVLARVGLLACLPAAGLGCASTGSGDWFRSSSARRELAQGPQVVSPRDRLRDLRKQAGDAWMYAGETRAQEAAGLTQAFMTEPDAIIRTQMLTTIAALDAAAGIEAYRKGIADSQSSVRLAAIRGWEKLGGPEAAQTLAATLNGDPDVDVRMAAARSLGRIPDAQSIAALGTALDDASPAMQYCVVQSLRSVCERDVGDDVNEWRTYLAQQPRPVDNSSIAVQMQRRAGLRR
jgi:HEAT repeat protein